MNRPDHPNRHTRAQPTDDSAVSPTIGSAPAPDHFRLNDPERSGLYQGFSAGPWVSDGTSAPFVFIDSRHGELRLQGQARGFVGHRMWVPDDHRPRGLFAQWSWDGRRLTAEVDPLGYFSLFVYARNRQIGLSPSILQLLAQGVDPEPDLAALAVYHRIGFFLEQDTPFTWIRTLPPGARLFWEDGTLRIEGVPPVLRTADLNREQAIEAFIEIPRASIGRFLRLWKHPITLPLSGGRDSRHVLLEMLHQGRPPDTCLTFHHGGHALTNEVQAARALTARAGLHHTLLGKPRSRLRDTARALLMTQLCADEHAQMMPMHDFLSGQAVASIDGIGGDILTTPDDMAAEFMQRSERGDYSGIARRLAAGHARVISHPGHQGGAGEIHSPAMEEAAIARITKALEHHAGAPDPYQSFWFWNRTRREISFVSASIMGGAETVFCPYLDPDMVELGLSLPWSVTRDQNLHDHAIQRAYPAYADIPFAEGFRSQTPGRLRPGRLRNIVDGFGVAALLAPDAPLTAIFAQLRNNRLRRQHADVYRLHSHLVHNMDADQAKRLMLISEQLSAAAPKGQDVVSDVFPTG